MASAAESRAVLLPDANLLVYAFREDCPEHRAAHDWLMAALDGPAPIALTSAALVGFVRVVTHPQVFRPPSAVDLALEFVAALWASPTALPVEPGARHPELFAELCRLTNAAGNDVPDAHLAAMAIESGAELASHDRGFGRFPGLRFTDPLD